MRVHVANHIRPLHRLSKFAYLSEGNFYPLSQQNIQILRPNLACTAVPIMLWMLIMEPPGGD